MAVLGFHFVTTLIGACILSKIVKHFSITRLLCYGLVRLGVPCERDFLEALSGNVKIKNKNKRRQNGASQSPSSDLYFPRSLAPMQLEPVKLSHTDLTLLPLYNHLQWLLDFSICSASIFLLTELALSLGLLTPTSSSPSAESNLHQRFTLNQFNFNMSLIWICLTVWFAFRALIAITAVYLPSMTSSSDSTSPSSDSVVVDDDDGKESTASSVSGTSSWPFLLATGFFYLCLSALLLGLDFSNHAKSLAPSRFVNFSLYDSFDKAFGDMDASSSSSTLRRWPLFHAFVSISSGFLAALLIFPGLKFTQLYVNSVKLASERPLQRLILHVSLVAPLLPMLLFFRPFTVWVNTRLAQLVIRQSHGPNFFLFNLLWTSSSSWLTIEGLRLASCVLIGLLQCITLRWQLQAYLYSAQDRLDKFKREPGRTSSRQVQRLVARIFYCFNLVALQLLVPVILLLSTTCLAHKAASAFSLPVTPPLQPDVVDLSTSSWTSTVVHYRHHLHASAYSIGLKTLPLLQSLLNYAQFWLLFVWQSILFISIGYYRFLGADE